VGVRAVSATKVAAEGAIKASVAVAVAVVAGVGGAVE
jgi:hypothetical protein